jgi:hypothetical protein
MNIPLSRTTTNLKEEFGMGTWQALLKAANAEQTLQRAQSALGLNTTYKLGRGGFDPTKPVSNSCDCSGFVSWAIGVPRELPPGSNQWLSTDSYWAGGKPVKAKLFLKIDLKDAGQGDLLVYPDSGGHQGHIGIITQVDHNVPTYVVHCSLGNFHNYHDAVRITGPGVFLAGNHATRIMRINHNALKSFG